MLNKLCQAIKEDRFLSEFIVCCRFWVLIMIIIMLISCDVMAKVNSKSSHLMTFTFELIFWVKISTPLFTKLSWPCQNKPTASLLRGQTLPTSVQDMAPNILMARLQ